MSGAPGLGIQVLAAPCTKQKRLENFFSSLGECPETRQLGGRISRQNVAIGRAAAGGSASRLISDAINV